MAIGTVRLGAVLVLLAATGVGGCVERVSRADVTGTVVGAPLAAAAPAAIPSATVSPASWKMPVQIAPVSADANGEPTVLSWVPDTGFVRATPATLASFGRPLAEVAGRNRTVEACRGGVEAEAAKLGAKDVEAASGGPDRTARDGRIFAPVRVRITYARQTGYEVRETTMTCVIDRRGTLVDAYM